jgi:hypothetical protein
MLLPPRLWGQYAQADDALLLTLANIEPHR